LRQEIQKIGLYSRCFNQWWTKWRVSFYIFSNKTIFFIYRFVCRTCVENKEIGMGEGKSKTDAKIISCEDAIKTLILAGNKDFQTSMEIRNLKPPPKPMTQAVRNPPQAVYKAQEEVFS